LVRLAGIRTHDPLVRSQYKLRSKRNNRIRVFILFITNQQLTKL
jgi:hypothetical protein